MLYPFYVLATLLAPALVSNVVAVAPTDSYSDADPAQSGYLPNHNMDPAVVDSSQFGQLWKKTFNAQEQVSSSRSHYVWHNHSTQCVANHNIRILVLREAACLHTQSWRPTAAIPGLFSEQHPHVKR